jgi:gamma-D-glutamyl-L-lysine dipeptidyl-peptidase
MPQKAICILSTIPMRAEPADRSEMVSQLLFGEQCYIHDQNDKWYWISSAHDDYKGWIDKKQVVEMDTDLPLQLLPSPLLLTNELGEHIRLSPGSWIPTWDHAFKIGQHTFTPQTQPLPISEQIQFGMQFLGTPYLWGGRSLYGIDCSGFTQLVARFNALALPRDANQQAEMGETIAFVAESQTGDYAFFDNSEGRIIHVGMVIRQDDTIQILHASGHVRMDELDHQGIYRRDKKNYSHALRIIKRIHNK